MDTHGMVLLINGSSFSDAEIFPNGFRANGLGKIVGVPTGGGVIGTNDQVLLDGQTRFRVPETRWTPWTAATWRTGRASGRVRGDYPRRLPRRP